MRYYLLLMLVMFNYLWGFGFEDLNTACRTDWDTLGAYIDTIGSIRITNGERYLGFGTSKEDSFWIYDSNDTTRFKSENPIEIGDASIIASLDDGVHITKVIQKYINYTNISTYDSIVFTVDTNYTATDTAEADHSDTVCMSCSLWYYDAIYENVVTNTGGWTVDTIFVNPDSVTIPPECGDSLLYDSQPNYFRFCDGTGAAKIPPVPDTLFLYVKRDNCLGEVEDSFVGYWDGDTVLYPVCEPTTDSLWQLCNDTRCVIIHYERYTIDLFDDFGKRIVTTVINTSLDGCSTE